MQALIAIKGKKKTGSKPMPKGRAIHIHARRLDNGGWSVDSEHEPSGPKKSGGKKNSMGLAMGMLGPSNESHSAGFAGPDEAMTHMGQMMGASAPASGPAPAGPPAPEAPPAPAGGAPAPGADDEE